VPAALDDLEAGLRERRGHGAAVGGRHDAVAVAPHHEGAITCAFAPLAKAERQQLQALLAKLLGDDAPGG
jgi:hypothetical protein